jgi:hypothetical protein
MTPPSPNRLALLLGLVGSAAISGGAALAAPWIPPLEQHRDWLQAQRSWAEQSYQQTQRRLDRLETCLRWARRPRDEERCMSRDQEARERQWQRDQQEWQALAQGRGTSPWVPWRPGF